MNWDLYWLAWIITCLYGIALALVINKQEGTIYLGSINKPTRETKPEKP
jgi:hypothetical protein